MEQLLEQAALETIGQVLAMLVLAWLVYNWAISAMNRYDEQWARDNPPCFDVKPGHAAKLVEGMREPSVFASMDSLTRPLKDYRNPTPPGDSMDEYFAKLEASERAALKGRP